MKQKSRRRATRQRILLAAAESFAENGFRGTTVRAICSKAKANVAAVNYYFGSKEQLYVEAYEFVFQHSPLYALADKPLEVASPADWERELMAWATSVLDVMRGTEKWHNWQCKLFARERTDPSKVLPVILEKYFIPIETRLDQLLSMALPKNTSDADRMIWRLSTVAQCTFYAQKTPPWDAQLFPAAMSRAEWLDRVARQVVGSVTSRLRYCG